MRIQAATREEAGYPRSLISAWYGTRRVGGRLFSTGKSRRDDVGKVGGERDEIRNDGDDETGDAEYW